MLLDLQTCIFLLIYDSTKNMLNKTQDILSVGRQAWNIRTWDNNGICFIIVIIIIVVILIIRRRHKNWIYFLLSSSLSLCFVLCSDSTIGKRSVQLTVQILFGAGCSKRIERSIRALPVMAVWLELKSTRIEKSPVVKFFRSGSASTDS